MTANGLAQFHAEPSTFTGTPSGQRPPVGLSVGAQRWPYSHAHPDCWGRPWRGAVLELDDPQAWANTLRFPVPAPIRKEVATHVAWCLANGMLTDVVPVLWDCGSEQRVRWDPVGRLRPYEQDLRLWRLAREAAREACDSLR